MEDLNVEDDASVAKIMQTNLQGLLARVGT